MRRISLAVTVTATALMALAPAGQAATRTVNAGWAGGPGVFPQLDTNSFFRSTITIHQGDTVKWSVRGFHNITFLGGQPKPGLAVPNTAQPVPSTTVDGNGVPYWFVGQPNIDINPLVGLPQGGKTYSSTKLTGSGLPAGEGAPASYSLKFNKRGTFTYYCTVHPGMAGRVKVVKKKTKVPSLAQNAAAARSQLARVVAAATKRNADAAPTGATVETGRSTSEYSIEAFFPSTLNVKLNEVVTFTMAKDTAAEPHTVTFGPEAATKPLEDGFVTPLPNPAGPPTLRLDPRAVYPSTLPSPTPVGYQAGRHGNGLENLGLLDNDPATPNPATAQVKFTQTGSYRYVCVIHPGMVGTVNVTA